MKNWLGFVKNFKKIYTNEENYAIMKKSIFQRAKFDIPFGKAG